MIEQDDIPFENMLRPLPGPVTPTIEREGTLSDGADDHAFVMASTGTAIVEVE